MQIQTYEMGSNRVSASKLAEFAALYGVDVNELLGIPSPISEEVVRLVRRPGSVPLLRAFAKIQHSHLRNAIIDLAESLRPS